MARPSGSRTIGTPEDLDAEVEVAHHPADDRQLLEVLPAERGDIGSGRSEQLGHDGHDATEVPGTHRPLQPLGEIAGLDVGLEAGRVHRRRRRRVDRVDAGITARGRGRRRSGAGSVSKSASRLNWSGLTKIVTTMHVGAAANRIDQREMTVVECAHRRDDADAPTLGPVSRATSRCIAAGVVSTSIRQKLLGRSGRR